MVSSIYSTMYSSMYNTTSTRKGLAGLVSGIDTDAMIQMMTAATRSKMAKLMQKQTTAAWKMEAYQNVTTSLLDFKNSFMNATSLTNMKNASFYQSAIITPQGENASAVSVTGPSSAALSNFSILSINNLATTAAFSSTKAVSQNAITSKDIVELMDTGYNSSRLENGSISLKFNGVSYNISLFDIETDTDPEVNAARIVEAINRGIDRTNLNGKVNATLDGVTGKVQLNVLTSNGNAIEIAGLSNNVKVYLGFEVGSTGNETNPIIGSEDIITASTPANPGETADINSHLSFNGALYGKSITFNLDGLSKTITFDNVDIFDNYNDFLNASDVAQYLNDKLGEAFGNVGSTANQKVSVTLDGNQLVFKTYEDTAILSLANGATGVTDVNGVLGINLGAANRLLMNESLATTNLNADAAALFADPGFLDGTGSVDMNVNGTNFHIFKNKIVVGDGSAAKSYEFANGTAMRDIINTVNNSSAGVRMQYNSTTDSFSVTSTESGSMGKAEITGDFADAIFGLSYTEKAGKDAELVVSFDGGLTSSTITRSSNNFNLNGMNITLNHTFAAAPGEEITFTSKANTDVVVGAIKDMVAAFNDIIALVNKEVGTRPDKDRRFQPLTAEQRKDMSKEEIELWEAKAKEGILFADSTLSSLASDLRFVFSMPIGDSSLSQIGIKSSTAWQDNGKLIIDEEKLRQAIENDPEKVADLFTRAAAIGDNSPASQNAGVMARIDAVMNKYVNTVGTQKGLLINRAGHESSPLSIMNSTIYKEIQSFDQQLKTLQTRLEKEEARYAKQFASLETFISKMNEQSSWLLQAFSSDNR